MVIWVLVDHVRAWMKGNIMYFDAGAWKLVREHARKQHRTPKQIAIAGLKRGIKNARKKGLVA